MTQYDINQGIQSTQQHAIHRMKRNYINYIDQIIQPSISETASVTSKIQDDLQSITNRRISLAMNKIGTRRVSVADVCYNKYK